MKYAMSKTAALKLARWYVGDIMRRGQFDYVYYAPYAEPGGPTTECRANGYHQARAHRTASLVGVALDLMEVEDTDLGHEDTWERSSLAWEIDRAISYLEIADARSVLNHVLSQLDKARKPEEAAQ